MIETYRMLGAERQGDLLREAERFHRADRLGRRVRGRSEAGAVARLLRRLPAGQRLTRVPRERVEVDGAAGTVGLS
jgi:hypothetical protein